MLTRYTTGLTLRWLQPDTRQLARCRQWYSQSMPTPKPHRTPKIRRIGNSVGVSISPALLVKAGLAEGDAVDVTASPGEIRIQRAGVAQPLYLTAGELNALITGDTACRAWGSLVRKAKKVTAG